MKLKKYQFKKVKSTNDIAIKKIKSGISRGLVIAETQSKGRGQYGKKWISFKGNLLMSIFFEINTGISIKYITFKNCEIIKKSIQKFTKNKIKIKPPNDLLINNEKIRFLRDFFEDIFIFPNKDSKKKVEIQALTIKNA